MIKTGFWDRQAAIITQEVVCYTSAKTLDLFKLYHNTSVNLGFVQQVSSMRECNVSKLLEAMPQICAL